MSVILVVEQDADYAERSTEALRSDGLSVETADSSADALSRDLPPRAWWQERAKFYDLALRHVVTPMRFFELFSYIPRLLAVAVSCKDWGSSIQILDKILTVALSLRQHTSGPSDESWHGFQRYLQRHLLEALLQATPFWNITDSDCTF